MSDPLDLDAIERDAKTLSLERGETGMVQRVVGRGATLEHTLALIVRVRAAEARLLAIARHAARLSKRDDMTDEEAIKHLLLVESDCITWQTDCAKCAETIQKSADDYLQMEARVRELEVKVQTLMAKNGKNQ